MTPDSAVLEKSANQADFTITIAQYLTQSVSPEGAALGHDLAASLAEPLEKIQARSGVQTVAAPNAENFRMSVPQRGPVCLDVPLDWLL